MAEEIVACPGCAKKFRIPEGAPPGTFPCTACSATVPYGAAPAAAAKGGARAPAKAAAPAARAAAPAARSAPARRAAPAPSQGRRAAREDDAPPKKSNQGLIWGGILVLGGGVVVMAYMMTRPDPAPVPPANVATAKPPATPATTTTPQVAPKPVEAPKPPVAAAPEAPKPATPEPAKPTTEDKPAAKPDAPVAKPDAPPAKPTASKGDFALLGQTFASVAGVSEAERAELDRCVTLVMDQSSAREGAEAEGKLVKAGKKAIPSILSGFSKQFNGAKWVSDSDQWSADKLQDILHRITGADGLNPDYWPRFMSGEPSEAFQKAATMWITWWNGRGQLKDKYKARND